MQNIDLKNQSQCINNGNSQTPKGSSLLTNRKRGKSSLSGQKFILKEWANFQENLKKYFLVLENEHQQQDSLIYQLKDQYKNYISEYLLYKYLMNKRILEGNYDGKKKEKDSEYFSFQKDLNIKIIEIKKDQFNPKVYAGLKDILKILQKQPHILAQMLTQENYTIKNAQRLQEQINCFFFEKLFKNESEIFKFLSYLIHFELEKIVCDLQQNQQDDYIQKLFNLFSPTNQEDQKPQIKYIYDFTLRIECQNFASSLLKDIIVEVLTYHSKINLQLEQIIEKHMSQKQKMERQKNRQTVAEIYKNIDIHNQFKEIKNEENKQQGNMDRWYNRLFKKLTNRSQEQISENQIISPKKKNAKFTSYKTFDKEEKKNQVVNKHIDQIQNYSHDNFVRDDFGINSTIQNQEEENDEIDNLSNKEQEELFVFVKYVRNRDEYDMDLETAFKIIKKVKIYVSKIEQLANNLIEKLVFNAQYFPRGQKILYALLRKQIINKFPQISTKHLNEIVTNLLIDKWLIPFSLDELQRNNAGNNKQIASDNFQIIWNLIKKVFKQEQFKDDYILEKLNPFIIKKQDTINKFFENIVNIDQNYIQNLYSKFQEDLKQDQNMEGKQNSQLQDEQEDIDNYDQILNLFIGFQETQELMNLVEVNINLISKFKKNAQQEIQLILRDLKNNKIFSDNQENFLWIFEPDSQQLGAYSDTMFKQQIKKDMSKEQIFATKFKNNMINFLQEIDNISNYIKLNQNIDLKIEDILFIHTEYFQSKEISFQKEKQKEYIPPYLYSNYLINLYFKLPSFYQSNQMEELVKEVHQQTFQKYQKSLIIMEKFKSVVYNKIRFFQESTTLLKDLTETLIKKSYKQNTLKFIQNQEIKIQIKFNQEQIKIEEDLASDKIQQLKNDTEFLSQLIPNQFIQKKISHQNYFIQNEKKVYIKKCKSIIEFIQIVSQLDIIYSALNDGKFINEVNEAICAYLEIVYEKIEQKFQNQPTSVIDSIYQLIEKFINRQIRNQDSFNGEPSLKDLQLQKLIQSYKFIDYRILEIEKFELEHDMWVSTANDLKKLWDYQSALEQLQFLSEIMKKVNSILRLSGYPSPGADDIQPLFIKIIILSNPPKLNTTLNMISSLLNMKKWSNEHFFYSYIMLKSSISYLQNLNNEKLGLELQEFQRLKEQSDNGDYDDL